MPLDRQTIIWGTLIEGAVHREGIALLMRDEQLALAEVLGLFHAPDYEPESNDQAMIDISRWTRDAVAKYPALTFTPTQEGRGPIMEAA